jgi:uncharacterized protein (TIGR03437 family)
VPVQKVSQTVGSLPAQVLYAGAAPGLVAGVLQINVVIPADAPSGNVPLYFSVDNANSVDMTSVAIQ